MVCDFDDLFFPHVSPDTRPLKFLPGNDYVFLNTLSFDAYNKEQDRPVSTTVRFIRNDSLIFPSITLCPYRDTL